MDFNQFLRRHIEYFNISMNILSSKTISFENQKKLSEYYNDIKNIDIIQFTLINVNPKINEHETQINLLINNLEILIISYNTNKLFFDGLNIEDICKIEGCKNDFLVKHQENILKSVGKELDALQEIVRHLGSTNYKEFQKNEIFRKYNIKRTEYLEEKSKFNVLFSKEEQYYSYIMFNYSKIIFEELNILNNSFYDFIKLNLVSKRKDIEIFYEKALLQKIYHLCNNRNFEEISFSGFFNNLNLLESNESLKVKNRNINYVCYLIKVLFEMDESDNKLIWRSNILEKLNLTKNYKRKSNQIYLEMKFGNKAELFYNNLHSIINEHS